MPLPGWVWLSNEASSSPNATDTGLGSEMQSALAETASGVNNPFDVLQDIVSGIGAYISENYAVIAWRLLLIVLTILAARFLLWGISKLTRRTIAKNSEEGQKNPRVVSSMTLLKSFARYVIYVVAIVVVLQIWFPNSNVVTGVFGAFSVGAVAVGFGTQSLVKDVVSGLFLSFENQFNVGDYIRTGDNEGIVEALALRVTYLRTFSGQQIIIPNGTIERVINYTRGGQQANITIPTPYDMDTRGVIRVIEGALAAWARQNEDIILEAPKVLGVSNYGERSVDINVVCSTQSLKAWSAEREMRLAIKEAFDASGIDFPYPQMEIHMEGEESGAKAVMKGKPPAGGKRNAGGEGGERRNQGKDGDVERPLWQTGDRHD